jgi:hypothetical protein
MTMQETQLEPTHARYDVSLDAVDPWMTPVDLNRFDLLGDDERMRIIIRVLCGLVAMEESAAPIPEERPAVAPTPGPGRRLPFLGLELAAPVGDRHRPRGWNTALLPHLGRERAF